ncbi:MAG TPA: DUF2075 domain-containing protein [Thermoanaerobaculaceae bacterium]|nr:DUF2075 domain-containing protein [Thermoanaerobaculaceae bacterium]HPS77286.1 DUF2075 domain-containing protein [Thermoanaerobaculaceae bacterium]
MQLYCGTTTQFVEDTVQNRIAEKLRASFLDYLGRHPSLSEINSWRNSLQAICNVIQYSHFDDNGLILEYQLPFSSKRLDFMITGRDTLSAANAVIVELKQWSEAQPSSIEGCVATFVGGRIRDELHPSIQVGQYYQYLADCHTAFSSGDIGLAACSYLHNVQFDPASEFFHPRHSDALGRHPLFTGDRTTDLAEFLGSRVRCGDGTSVLRTVLESKYRASKKLLDHTAEMVDAQQAYVLLDEQLVVFNSVLAQAKAGFHERQKVVVLVQGGPGTGKSIIALNLIGRLSRLGYNAIHATGSKAFTENIRKIVGSRAGSQFRYFFNLASAQRDEVDVLVCDEAHRIRATSSVPRQRRISDKTQIEDLILAAKVAVFFIDDLQIVRPGEVGSSDLIRSAAAKLGARVYEYKLEAQFRCAGSDAFVDWVDNTLGVRPTASDTWEQTEVFDFRIIDSVEELEGRIREKAAAGFTARLAAGFCWPWSDPLPDGTLAPDVVVGTWQRPWNAKADAGRLRRGIPKSNFWASDPAGIEQVGCVYTAQGFEFDYIGVIFGKDLRYDPKAEMWIGDQSVSEDAVVKRAKENFVDLVKNTYRVLLTRGIKGCYVHFMDRDTEQFFRARIGKPLIEPPTAELVASPTIAETLSIEPFRRLDPEEVRPFQTSVPLYDLAVAAGRFSAAQTVDEVCLGHEDQRPQDFTWVELPDSFRIDRGLFVAKVVGESMNRRIPNGQWCLFRLAPRGSRNGRVVIAQHRDISDPDTGGQYTVKVYESRKAATPDGSWRHESITLRPDSSLPGFEPIVLSPDQADDLRILAELVAVLG